MDQEPVGVNSAVADRGRVIIRTSLVGVAVMFCSLLPRQWCDLR